MARGRRPAAAAALLALAVAWAAPARGGGSDPAQDALDRRGDVVVRLSEAYRARLQGFYDALAARLTRDAPGLLPVLRAIAPPAPLPRGHGLLPELEPDPPPPSVAPRAVATWYSWPWTEERLRKDEGTLRGLQGALERHRPGDGEAALAPLVDGYRTLFRNYRVTDEHIQYNRLWQAEVVRQRSAYDRSTVLYHHVLERQALLDALHAGEDAAFRAALAGTAVSAGTRTRAELEPEIRAREQSLAALVHAETDRVSAPDFVRVRTIDSRLREVEVPLYTDIPDAAFVERFRQAVETHWQVRDGEDEFRVRLALRPLPDARPYREAPPRGVPLDLKEHCARFPADGAVLTTGASTTHVLGRCIALGTAAISPHRLAHEFGHVLGFRDVYFRGYEDLGKDGFRLMEVVAEPGDIMGAPGTGPVLRRHFERLLAALGLR